jgi:hypothetical protein
VWRVLHVRPGGHHASRVVGQHGAVQASHDLLLQVGRLHHWGALHWRRLLLHVPAGCSCWGRRVRVRLLLPRRRRLLLLLLWCTACRWLRSRGRCCSW